MYNKKEADTLLIHIEQSKPIEIGDFTKSLNGLCGLFTQYAAEKGMCGATTPKLYVSKIQEGCIDVFLQLAEAFVPFVTDANIYFDFVSHIRNIKNFFVKGEGEKPNLSKAELENLSDSMAFVVKDPKGSVDIQAIKGVSQTIYNNCPFVFIDGNGVQNQVSRLKKELLETQVGTSIYTNQLLTICQAKRNIAEETGNRGRIDTLNGGKPLKLVFDTPELKQSIFLNQANPFTKVFQVDVEIQTANGKPFAYSVKALHDVLDID